MNLNKMRHLLEVERSRSFSIAAKQLSLTQSAVTKSVSGVEQELGFAIFIRTSRGVELTEEGRDFIDRLRRVMTDVYDLLDDMKDQQKQKNERLRVGVCPASLEAVMVDMLGEWAKAKHAVIIEIRGGSIEQVVRDLRRGDLDIIFGSTIALANWKELSLESIPSLEIEIFVRKGHPLANKPLVTRKDISQFDFVSPTNIEPIASLIRDIYEKNGQASGKRMHVIDYFPSVRRFVLATDCPSFVVKGYANTPHFRSEFDILSLDYLFPNFQLGFAHYSRRPLKTAAKNFIHYFRQKV